MKGGKRMTKKKTTERKFETSDSLKRFIPPPYEIGKVTPPKAWDTSRRSASYGERREDQDQAKQKDKRRAAMMQ
jgi:hypothetical protein